MSTLLSPFQRRANLATFSVAFLFYLTLSGAVNYAVKSYLSVPVTTRHNSPFPLIPDMCWLGYSPSELTSWLEEINEQGRAFYFFVNVLDFFIIMPSYVTVLVLGLILAKNPFTWWCHIPFLVLAFDLVETVVLSTVNFFHPATFVQTRIIHTASLATQMKFIFVLVSFVGIVVGLAMGRNKPTLMIKKE